MKQTFTTLVFLALVFSLEGQVVFESFDTAVESNYVISTGGLTDTSRVIPFMEESIVSEGDGALLLKYNIESAFDWGGGSQFRIRHPEDQGLWDFSEYESLSIDFYNKVPSNFPGRATLQLIFFDASEINQLSAWGLIGMEWWYSYHQVLDLEQGWNKIEISLEDVGVESSTGFYLPVNDGSGVAGNNSLDLDKIRAFAIAVAVSGPNDSENISGEFVLDNFLLHPGTSTASASMHLKESDLLGQNYPNPFYEETNIRFNLAHRQNVKLSVFDSSGKEVRILINEALSPGEYNVPFSAEKLSGGIYYYQLQAGERSSTRKMILLR